MTEKVKLADLETYVYIDVSNIKNACKRSCGFDLDFVKLIQYLKRKYLELREVRYYEGIAVGDEGKRRYFRFLGKIGYRICALERKSYTVPATYGGFSCKKCGVKNMVQLSPATVTMKSNVDVYLAAEMLERVASVKQPTNIILVSCDGDYAEAIRVMLRINPNVRVTVLATPATRKNNCLSTRLRELNSEFTSERYGLASIENIKGMVARDIPKN